MLDYMLLAAVLPLQFKILIYSQSVSYIDQ